MAFTAVRVCDGPDMQAAGDAGLVCGRGVADGDAAGVQVRVGPVGGAPDPQVHCSVDLHGMPRNCTWRNSRALAHITCCTHADDSDQQPGAVCAQAMAVTMATGGLLDQQAGSRHARATSPQ